MKNQKQHIKILLIFCVVLILSGVGCELPKVPDAQEAPRSIVASELEEIQRGGYTLNEIRAMLQRGDASGFKRVYRPDSGTITYQISAEELLEVFGSPMTDNEIRSFNDFDYARRPNARPDPRPIFGEGRLCSESIVLVLLGDGFTAGNGYGQVGDYRNPGVGTFLRSAHEFAYTLTNMYPFSLFRDFFKIYAVETPSTQMGIRVGTAPYPGTYFGTFLNAPWRIAVPTRSAHALDISNQVSPNVIMTQMIINTRLGGGVAWNAGAGYYNLNTLGISTRFLDTFIAGWNRPAYHSIVVHEIGHNFGRLMDEHEDITVQTWHLGRANIARATDANAQLKWGHWLGHAGITRRTVNAPAGHIFPSPNHTCKMQGWRATFCAVCRAELTRRMAMISGETFEAGRRPDGTVRPLTPNITAISQRNRILPYAFHGNTSLQAITIPASITTIGDFAFIGATNLRSIDNRSLQPQPINDTTFAGLDRSKISVHVPLGTKEAFKAAGWSGFYLRESLGMPGPAPAHIRIDFANERLTGFVAGHTYRIRFGGTHHSWNFTPSPGNTHSPIQENRMGSLVSISRIIESPFNQTMEFHLIIPDRPAPPLISGRNPTVPRFDNGQILGVRPGMQWRMGTSGHWQPVFSPFVTGLRAGTYEVRHAATGTSFASAVSRVVLSNQIPELYSIPVRIQNGNGEVLYSTTFQVYHNTQIGLYRLRHWFLPGIFEQGFIPGYHFSETAWLHHHAGICEFCCGIFYFYLCKYCCGVFCEHGVWVTSPNFSIALLFLPVP